MATISRNIHEWNSLINHVYDNDYLHLKKKYFQKHGNKIIIIVNLEV